MFMYIDFWAMSESIMVMLIISLVARADAETLFKKLCYVDNK